MIDVEVKIWSKKCPSCDNVINYNTKHAYMASIRKNCRCMNCVHVKKVKFCLGCNYKMVGTRRLHNKSGYCQTCTINNYRANAKSCFICNKSLMGIVPFEATDYYTKIINYTCSNECVIKLKAKYYWDRVYSKHNDRYDYGLVKLDLTKRNLTDQLVDIICSNHGKFNIRFGNHVNGRGCTKCQMSKGEYAIMEYFKKNNINYTAQKTFDDCRNPLTNCKLKYDFFVPDKNLLIEFDGEQHYVVGRKVRNHIMTQDEINKVKARDALKTQYALNKGIKLLRIPYTELGNIDDILKINV